MTPATQLHTDADVGRNLFLVAVLGLVAEQRRVRELARRLIARAPRRGGRARKPGALEYALLGAVSFGLTLEHRLGRLAGEAATLPHAEGDAESCLRTLLV
jgi:hypothetical protein